MQDATPLLITVPAQGERLIGRSVDAAVRLPHQSVSNRHAIIERIDGALVLRDLESKYGTHVNGMRIVRTVLRLDDQVRFGQATTYRVKSEGLSIDHAPLGVQLRCEHLNVFGLDHGSRVAIAQDISFSVEPSSFVGILGPSGCGKSTLLNVLATYHSEYDGRLRIDDEFDLRDEPERYCELLGHVPQTDLVHSQLTVRESLAFATELRGGDSQADVERVLELIELNSHADKQCRHLSGGQRKRLCVGYELLRRPRLLLLDEPTAGLDPATESGLMAHFRLIAAQGTTVICTTHIMDNMLLFDRVVVLGLQPGIHPGAPPIGTVAFVGPPAELLDRLRCRTFADLYAKLAQGQFEVSRSTDDLPREKVEAPTVGLRRVSDTSRRSSGAAGTGRLQSTVNFRRRDQDSVAQIGCLLRRSLIALRRSRKDNMLRLCQPVALGTLTSLTQFGTAKEFHVGFFCVVTAIWLGMNNSVPDLVRERGVYVREALAGLRRDSYLATKAILHLAVGGVQLVCLLLTIAIVGYFTLDQTTWKHLFEPSVVALISPVLLLSYAGGVAVGMLVSTMAKNEQSAVYWLPILIMPQLMLSAVATGVSDESYRGDHPFRPIQLWHAGQPTDPDRPVAAVVDWISMLLFSRPASILLDSRATATGWGWIADAVHLVLLVLASSLAQYLTFCHREKKWQHLRDD